VVAAVVITIDAWRAWNRYGAAPAPEAAPATG
jgi:hypothetical protein